ncbi:hypothetical protein EW026_g3743 [Hermanssonia centrifuga]|uniref:Uncharacterized protein n=1 Tax=Hermanssonia centrifuga TaxID=98765 RepID=A0A4S4KJQ6_9APHY|nr:hypothetical protein EW026_g3743 [Hermanssonia centrifuga]
MELKPALEMCSPRPATPTATSESLSIGTTTCSVLCMMFIVCHAQAANVRPHGHVLPAPLVLQPTPIRAESVPPNQPHHIIAPPDDSGALNTLNPEGLYYEFHSELDGRLCDSTGVLLPDANVKPPPRARLETDWSPYDTRLEFETAEFLFQRVKMGQANVNLLLELWAASLVPYGGRPPFASVQDMLQVIDSTAIGDAPWTTMTAKYMGCLPPNPPSWMVGLYEISHRNPLVCARNMLMNPDFSDEFDVVPYREYDGLLKRQYTNLMSGDWAWKQADLIAVDPEMHGAMFCPLILGSDKTTVSVATGQNDYYPLYMSLGNVWNNVRRAHHNAVVVIAFLAIPKTEKRYAKDPVFRKFRRQLFHSSLATILNPLKCFMEKPDVVRCPDGHFRRAIYGLGPYIADYIEQVLATNTVQGWCVTCPTPRESLGEQYEGPDLRSREHTELLVDGFDLKTLWDDYGVVGELIPFTNDFPRADIYQLMSGDLLHQVIKGCFKDHLVEWVNEYLKLTHGQTRGNEIIDQIDRRIAAAPAFAGLRRFKQGRDFKQWTGDDSKALMKVYLPAVSVALCKLKILLPRSMIACNVTIAYVKSFAHRARDLTASLHSSATTPSIIILGISPTMVLRTACVPP